MLYFTNYANKKFEILNKYQVFITKEEIEDVVNLPDQTDKKGEYLFSQKGNIKVVLKKEDEMSKIVTFYPVKS